MSTKILHHIAVLSFLGLIAQGANAREIFEYQAVSPPLSSEEHSVEPSAHLALIHQIRISLDTLKQIEPRVFAEQQWLMICFIRAKFFTGIEIMRLLNASDETVHEHGKRILLGLREQKESEMRDAAGIPIQLRPLTDLQLMFKFRRSFRVLQEHYPTIGEILPKSPSELRRDKRVTAGAIVDLKRQLSRKWNLRWPPEKELPPQPVRSRGVEKTRLALQRLFPTDEELLSQSFKELSDLGLVTKNGLRKFENQLWTSRGLAFRGTLTPPQVQPPVDPEFESRPIVLLGLPLAHSRTWFRLIASFETIGILMQQSEDDLKWKHGVMADRIRIIREQLWIKGRRTLRDSPPPLIHPEMGRAS